MFCSANASKRLRITSLTRAREFPVVSLPNTRRAFEFHRGITTNQNVRVQYRAANLATPQNLIRPTATWLATTPAVLDIDTVLDQLPRTRDIATDDLRGKLNTALFVVTPAFYHLFSNGHPFHAAAVERIFQSEKQPLTCKTIVAVVDALPALHEASCDAVPQRTVGGYEGLGVCVSADFQTSPYDEAVTNGHRSLTLRASKLINSKETMYVVRYQAPLANTIFVNGQQSTMFTQTWVHNGGNAFTPVENSRQELSDIEIPFHTRSANRHREIPGSMHTNLMHLTSPAVIKSSMGNIIREIKIKEGNIVSASQELETIIPPLVKSYQSKLPEGEFRVYALVYERDNHGVPAKNPHYEPIYELKDQAQAHSPSAWSLRGNAFRRFMARGPRLHRVTSGGAGWGKKAGLLSLDPKTDIAHRAVDLDSVELSFDFASGSLKMPEPKNLFPPGYVVQFLGAWFDPTGRPGNAPAIADVPKSAWLRTDYFDASKRQAFCLGTTVLPEISARHTDESTESGAHRFLPNRFGILSTNAWSLSVRPAALQRKRYQSTPSSVESKVDGGHSTLIEVPNSHVIASSSAGGIGLTASLHPGKPRTIQSSSDDLAYRIEKVMQKYAELFRLPVPVDFATTRRTFLVWFKRNFNLQVVRLEKLSDHLQRLIVDAHKDGVVVEEIKSKTGLKTRLEVTLYRLHDEHHATIVSRKGVSPSQASFEPDEPAEGDGSERSINIRYTEPLTVRHLGSSKKQPAYGVGIPNLSQGSSAKVETFLLDAEQREKEEDQLLKHLFEDLDLEQANF